MPKYIIKIQEKNYGCIEVEAENIEDAREKARDEEDKGNVIWHNSEIEITDIVKYG